MTDCPHNINLNSLLRQETDSSRSCLPRSSKVVEKPRQENDAWCVVATDGSTSIIACKSAPNVSESNVHNHAISQDRRTAMQNATEDLPDFHEVGVDQSYLNVEKETASKLIAGMHAMVDIPTTSLRRAIGMPRAVTNLQEIFKTDDICMVSRPKTATKGFRIQGPVTNRNSEH